MLSLKIINVNQWCKSRHLIVVFCTSCFTVISLPNRTTNPCPLEPCISPTSHPSFLFSDHSTTPSVLHRYALPSCSGLTFGAHALALSVTFRKGTLHSSAALSSCSVVYNTAG